MADIQKTMAGITKEAAVIQKKAVDIEKKVSNLSPRNRLVYDEELASLGVASIGVANLGGELPEGLSSAPPSASGIFSGIANFFGSLFSRAPKEIAAAPDGGHTGGESGGGFLGGLFGSRSSGSSGGGSNSGSSSGGGRAEAFFNIYSSGNYHMKSKTTVEGMEVISETWVKDGMIATAMEMNGQSTRTVMRDGKSFVIMDSEKMVMSIANTQTGVDPGHTLLRTQDMFTYSNKSGTARFNGKNLHYEEYSYGKNAVQYFLDGSKLAGVRIINDGAATAEMVILELNQNVPANVFDIPRGYTLIEY